MMNKALRTGRVTGVNPTVSKVRFSSSVILRGGRSMPSALKKGVFDRASSLLLIRIIMATLGLNRLLAAARSGLL